MVKFDYDVAVLGSGPGGYVAALRAALRGAKVVCIEKGNLGGTCLNVGCIPTKTMLHSSETFWGIKQSAKLGITAESVQLDAAIFMKNTAKVVRNLRNGVGFLLKKRGVEIINGYGRLTDEHSITVETGTASQVVTARSIILASGSRPARPGFLPWDCPALMTTDQATTAENLPKSVLILGGGVIGCEFATVYAELGIPVVLVEMLDKLVANLDQDIIQAVTRSLKKRKVKIITGMKLTGIQPGQDTVTAQLEDGQNIEVEKVLVATGRQAVTDDIGLEQLGIVMENHLVKVNHRCQSSIPHIYAIGDIAEMRQYAHLASRMGIVAGDNASGFPAEDDRQVVPSGIYTHPEVATVGLSQEQAQQEYSDVKVAKFPYAASGMAQAYGQIEGMVKLIGRENSGQLVGAVIIGPHATDTIQEAALALRNGVTIQQLAHTIHPHPTFGEAIGEAAESWLDLPIHTL